MDIYRRDKSHRRRLLRTTVLQFDGVATSVVVAPLASAIQDLHAGAFTAEAWISPDDWGETNQGRIFDKTDGGAEGWVLAVHNAVGIYAVAYTATTNAESYLSTVQFSPDGEWHHITMQLDGAALPAGSPKTYLWIDGVPAATYGLQRTAVGAAVTDVGNDLGVGNEVDGTRTFDGRLGGWARLSDSLRYTPGTAFIPNARTSPPAVDANTAWQTNYRDGYGAALVDASAGANNGVITDGAGGWVRDRVR